ncbi:hypothetical protein Q3G72_009864 [Acer saccharum]|nr:hypothetical protein Q3G72_009864 [Acer saccharum]
MIISWAELCQTQAFNCFVFSGIKRWKGSSFGTDNMEMEQYFEESVAQNDFGRGDKSSVKKWKSATDAVAESDDSPPGGFDCNICLDCVQEPVVTLCGHLYCWPCIYKWLNIQSSSIEDQDQKQQQCPVCKAEVSPDTLVPLYGRGKTMKPSNGKAPHLGIVIPRRPLGPVCGVDSPRSPGYTMSPRLTPQSHHRNHPQPHHLYYSQPGSYLASPMSSPGGTTTNAFDPMFGEMVYSRLFGNPITNTYTYPNTYNLAASTSPRIRRHVMQADKSLNRICFFLLCCMILCLLLF